MFYKNIRKLFGNMHNEMQPWQADLGFWEKYFLMLLRVCTALGNAIICPKKNKTTRQITKIEEKATCRASKYDHFLSKTEIYKYVSAKLTYQV